MKKTILKIIVSLALVAGVCFGVYAIFFAKSDSVLAGEKLINAYSIDKDDSSKDGEIRVFEKHFNSSESVVFGAGTSLLNEKRVYSLNNIILEKNFNKFIANKNEKNSGEKAVLSKVEVFLKTLKTSNEFIGNIESATSLTALEKSKQIESFKKIFVDQIVAIIDLNEEMNDYISKNYYSNNMNFEFASQKIIVASSLSYVNNVLNSTTPSTNIASNFNKIYDKTVSGSLVLSNLNRASSVTDAINNIDLNRIFSDRINYEKSLENNETMLKRLSTIKEYLTTDLGCELIDDTAVSE